MSASDAAAYVSGSVYGVDGALSVAMPSGGSSEYRQGAGPSEKVF